MSDYEKALEVATRAHAGQKRKNGEDYINHCVRVAERMHQDKLKVIAILHDVIEDSDFCVCDLQNWFGDEIAFAVRTLTRKHDQSYLDYILEVKNDGLAIHVKWADLEDNLNGATGTLLDKYLMAKWILAN